MRTRVIAAAIAPLLLLVVLASCRRGGASPAPASTPAPPPASPYPAATRIYYDNGGGIQDSLREVIKDTESFTRRWQQATSPQSSPPSSPVIDFGENMIVLVAAGRMTPDDQIRVDSATLSRAPDAAGVMTETLNVVVRTTIGCRRFNAPAHPLELVRLRRFDGPVRFVERRVQAEGCLPPEPMRHEGRERLAGQ
jgi:hypothetical protein